MKSQEQDPLPDSTQWQPRAEASETLKAAFQKRCKSLEAEIRLRVQAERQMNIDNYDSGSGVEDIIRKELTSLLPMRYSVRAGVVNDRKGNTAGDLDIVIFNDTWFPQVKSGATEGSRRAHLPIDGVYAVCEVKQTLDFETLDEAMKKLVICHRLHRPRTYAYRVVENREGSQCSHGLTNPLYSAIIATEIAAGLDLDDIVNRFFDINKSLRRLEVVRALCVLNVGAVTWGFRNEQADVKPALFMLEDLYRPIFPVYHKVPVVNSPLFALMSDLLLHLFHSVLAPEDIALSYGPDSPTIKLPRSDDITLQPDSEWVASLQEFCKLDEDRGRRHP
jgi:hypothetical protein